MGTMQPWHTEDPTTENTQPHQPLQDPQPEETITTASPDLITPTMRTIKDERITPDDSVSLQELLEKNPEDHTTAQAQTSTKIPDHEDHQKQNDKKPPDKKPHGIKSLQKRLLWDRGKRGKEQKEHHA